MPRQGGNEPQSERYWTDYLRIALPILGLVVMLAVFIFWAQAIIGKDGNSPTPTVIALSTTPQTSQVPTATAGAALPTAIPTEPAGSVPANASASGPSQPAQATSTNEPSASQSENSAASSEPSASDQGQASSQASDQSGGSDQPTFAVGDVVTVNEDGVRVRSDASTDSDEVTTVNNGDTVTIVDGPKTGGDYDWYQIETSDGQQGWVAGDFLSATAG